jgi:hypothetical protein
VKITKEIAAKVLDVVDAGLCSGLDDGSYDDERNPLPGHMCVEAAVCYAIGEEHHDHPRCVDSNLRSFKIELNDQDGWASNVTRARGLRELAIAQLGTRGKFDSAEFASRLKFKLLREGACKKLLLENPMNRFAAAALREARNHVEFEGAVQDWSSYSWEAEVALNELDNSTYEDRLEPYLEFLEVGDPSEKTLRKIAAAAVEVLVEMKTPGSKYLYLAREKKVAKGAKKKVKARA